MLELSVTTQIAYCLSEFKLSLSDKETVKCYSSLFQERNIIGIGISIARYT